MTLNKSQVNGNTPAGRRAVASGGGIVNVDIGVITNAPISGVLTINDSPVNNNTAGGDGGGIANGFTVGKMSLPGGSITMYHSQVMGNTAAQGGGPSTTVERLPWRRPPSAATTPITASRKRPSLDALAETSLSGFEPAL